MKKIITLGLLLISPLLMADTCKWSQWEEFKSVYIENGRVVDGSDDRLVTTSEGQSYALFFALVADDQQAFNNILKWTQKNLADGDLTTKLPSWLWGKKDNGNFGIIDSNPASDSDLWIAYSLAEAGRLWNNYYYQSLGYLLANRILREETVEIDGMGTVLLPAPQGFDFDNHYRINPSYSPLQLITRMQTLYPKYSWNSMYQTSFDMLMKTIPAGFSPDWATLKEGQYNHDKVTGPIGSYNSIRTYLWAGMLDDQVPEKADLIKKMQPFIIATKVLGAPPRKVNTITGKYSKIGNSSFSAAILPLLTSTGNNALVKIQADLAQDSLVTDTNNHYYQNVLSLFGLGWHNELYRFGKQGQLLPAWSTQCQK
jgi:endoglucanase